MLSIRSQYIIERVLFVFDRSYYLWVPLLGESTLDVQSNLFLNLKIINSAFLKVEGV